VTLLGRCGVFIFRGLRIAYLNGRENKKFLSEDEKFYYTGCYFSRNDIDRVIQDTQGSKLKTDILLLNSIPSIIYDEMAK
jgi:hypothetical protein